MLDIDLSQINAAADRLRRRNSRRLSKAMQCGI